MSTKQASTSSNRRSQEIKHVLQKSGYLKPYMIAKTLQGSIWRATMKISPTKSQSVIAKVTDKELHSQSVIIIDNQKYYVDENIMKEMSIQKNVTQDTRCPKSIVRYLCSFATDKDIYFIQEDGGSSLFEFIVKGHNLMKKGSIEVSEWHRVIKIIFKQMVECIEYIHSKRVCHFDISLENFLINDVPVSVTSTSNGTRVKFCCDEIQVKLCDFGLAEKFKRDSFKSSKYCGKTNYKSPEITSKKKSFNAKSNDVWCLGICLFMMAVGSAPWTKAAVDNPTFNYIVSEPGESNKDRVDSKKRLIELLDSWNTLQNVNKDLIVLLESILKYEEERCDLDGIKNCSWMKM